MLRLEDKIPNNTLGLLFWDCEKDTLYGHT